MEIEECFVCGKKNDDELCEDAVAVASGYVAVIDGSTSKGTMKYLEKSTGRTAAELIKQYIECKLDVNADIKIFAEEVTALIRNAYVEAGVADMVAEHAENRMTASTVVYCDSRKAVWMIGDCQCMVDGVLHTNAKKIDDVLAYMRASLIALAMKRGASVSDILKHDVGREAIMPLLREQCNFQNDACCDEFSYGVIDGFEIPQRFLKVIDVSGAHSVVLASDGYPKLMPTLNESECELNRLIVEDPLMVGKFKATKGLLAGQCSFDDRSYLRLTL